VLGSDTFGDFSEQRFRNIVKRNRYWQGLAKKRRIKDDNKLVTEASASKALILLYGAYPNHWQGIGKRIRSIRNSNHQDGYQRVG